MGQNEKNIIKMRLLGLKENERLFRINAGMGWQGEVIRRSGDIIILKNPRPLHAAPDGWPDLCGFQTIVITPEMIGRKIAVFVAEEIKAGKDKMRPSQKRFKDLIEKMGGIFRILK